MFNELIEIEDDIFDICKRLKEIDATYYIVFNKKTRKFELHSSSNKKNSLCLILPFEKLDCRTVNYALVSRVENCSSIFQKIEENNEEIDRLVNREIKNELNFLARYSIVEI